MPRNVSKIAKRLSKWRADTCQALSRAACGDTLADAVRAILRKTANIFKKIRDDDFDEEQCGQVSRELVTILCQVSSNLHFRARDLLPAVESVGATTRFDYWDNQCAILSYVLDFALVLNEPSAVAKVLFTLSKNKHRVWDVLVQTEAIASTAALDERDKVLDVFRWLAAYCPRTCSNPELYFKFIACAACLARRLHERGWKTVKPTALTIEPAEFDFEEWFAAQPALVVLLPPSADPRPRRKVIAQLCKSASSHEELLKACKAISESGGSREPNIRSACDAEATTEDDFFTIVDDGLEAREHATAAPQVEDQQLQVILESTLNRIHSSLASPRMTDSEVNSELISEASLSPLNTRAFLDKLLSGTSVGHTTSAASDGGQKSGNLLEKDYRHNGRAADKGDGSRGGTQEVAASEDESCVKATPDPVDSPHEIRKQSRTKKVLQRNASQGETASSVTETAQECGAPSAITVDSEKGEPSGLQLSGRKHVDKVRSLSAAGISDATTQRVDERTPLKRTKRHSSTDECPEKQVRDQESAKVGGKLPPLRERRDAPQDSSTSQVRPVAEKVKAAFVQRDSSHVVVKPSLQESKGKLKGQSGSENEAVVVAVANRRSKIYRARKKAEECLIIDSSEEELSHEECLEESRARLPSDDANGMVLSPGEESECGGPGSGSEGAGSEVRSSAGAVKAASSQRSTVYSAGEVASAKATGNLESQSGSEEVELGTEASSRRSSKGRGLRKARQRIIKHSSEEESCSEQNVEKDDMRSASDNADETTSNVGTEPPGTAQSSGSDSESPGLQARRAKKLVKAALMRRQSSRIASTVSPEGCGKSGGLSSSDEGASAEEAVSARSRKVWGARKARRRRISDSSEDKSCSEQNLEDGVNLAFDDDVEMHSVKGAGSVRGVPSSSSDPESASEGSPSSSIKKRTATLLASGRGAASVGRKVVRKLDKLSRSRISSSSEEESQVKHVSKGSAELSTPRRAEEHEASSGSECELPKESLDDQSATRSSIRKSVTATPSLASNGRAALSSPNLRRPVSRASKEQRNRIGALSQHKPCTSPISKGDYKTSGVKCTCSPEASSGSESDLPLSQKALSQSVNKVHRSRIVSSSESSDGEHGAEVSVQPDTACREVPSESDDDKIPCGQRPPSTSSSSECTHFSSSDSESEEGPHSQKLPHKRCLATESEADTVDMLSGDEEGLSEKRSSARFSEATTVAASPERRSASPFPQARAAQTSRNGCQAENDADTGATQGSAENSVFKLPILKRARTVSAHREVGSKSQDEHGGLDKRVSGSSPLERSAKGKTDPVTNTTLTRRTLRSRSSEPSRDENLRQSDQEGFAELASGDTGLRASHKVTASTSLNCSIPALEGMPSVHSDSVSSNRAKTSIREESSDALHLHNVHTDANEAPAFGRSASQNSLKTEQERAVARESPQVNGRRRTSPRKRTTSGPSCLEAAMHKASSECDADVTRSSKERSVLNTQAQQCSSTKSRRGAQVSSPQSSEVSDDIELELPQKHLCTLSNEKRGSPVTRRELGAHSEESSAGRSEQAGPDNLQKNLPSPGKHDGPAKLLVRTRSTRRQLLANVSASLSPRNKVADCMRAVGSGKAPDTLEQTSSSEHGDITDDSSEQESPRKRLSSQAASSKEKKTLSGTRKKSGTSLEAARACRSEQLAASKQKSPSSLVKDDIVATVLTRSARKRLSTNVDASVSLEKNTTAKSTRAERPGKATDTLDAASAWEKLRNISEEILDSDAESGMSSLIDHSPSLLTDLSSTAQKKRAILVEKRLGEHKVVSESKRHSTRLCASQTGLCTASQLRLRSTKNDAEAVVPVTSSQESSKGNLDSSGVQNESIARSSAMHEHPKQCCTQDLSQSSSKLDGLTQAPLSPRLRQREAGASQLSQRQLGQLGKKGCAVNASEALSSSFVSLGEDNGDETASVAESRGLSPLSKNNDSPTAPKLDLVYHGAQGSGTRKSGRLSLAAIRSSQSEASEDPKSAPSVNNRRAVTNGAIEQPTLSAATRTRSSSSAHASSPDSKKQVSGAKKRPTRTSASLGSQDYRAAEALVSLSQQVVDAAYIKESSAVAPATRRSARLSLRRGSLGSQASSSLLMAVAQEERNSSDDEGDRRLTRSRSVRTTPSSKDYDAADHRTPPVQVVLDRLQDVSKTGRRSKDACSACQRSSPETQNSGTMTDESYLHDEADFSNLSTSTKRRRTDRRSVAAASQQKTTTSMRRLRQCSMGSPQTSAPVRRSTRTAANVSRRLSYA